MSRKYFQVGSDFQDQEPTRSDQAIQDLKDDQNIQRLGYFNPKEAKAHGVQIYQSTTQLNQSQSDTRNAISKLQLSDSGDFTVSLGEYRNPNSLEDICLELAKVAMSGVTGSEKVKAVIGGMEKAKSAYYALQGIYESAKANRDWQTQNAVAQILQNIETAKQNKSQN
jgi:hypothetical protein